MPREVTESSPGAESFLDDERPSPLGLGKGRFFMAMLGLTLFCMDCSQDWPESGFFSAIRRDCSFDVSR